MKGDTLEKPKRKAKVILIIGIILLLIALIVLFWDKISVLFGNKQYGVLYQDELTTVKYGDLDGETLYITKNRKNYKDLSMRLIIPRLELDTLVTNDTIPEKLKDYPGLYEVSQMPREKDGNVSIAGHRDLGNNEFYYLHTIEEGDYIYLIYEGEIFQYEFFESKVVQPDDWSVILPQGFNALTLTTCDPIGTRLRRLIVVGNLVSVTPETDEFQLAMSKE